MRYLHFFLGKPSVFEHMVANVFGMLSLRDRSLCSGEDDRSRLNRIGYHVDQGDLLAATVESDKLSGAEVRAVVRDWLADCKEFVALEQVTCYPLNAHTQTHTQTSIS